jgi:hypothetical protein
MPAAMLWDERHNPVATTARQRRNGLSMTSSLVLWDGVAPFPFFVSKLHTLSANFQAINEGILQNICVLSAGALVYYKDAALIHQANLYRLAAVPQTR